MRLAIVIGHSFDSQGAINNNHGTTEFEYNSMFALLLNTLLDGSNIEPMIVYRDSYRDLPDKINELDPDLIISLHCNAYNHDVSGAETLYYHSSKIGKKLASGIQKTIVEVLKLDDRGIKPKYSEDRGGYLLRYTNAPCIIIEPFFIDNNKDLKVGWDCQSKLAIELAEFIKSFKL